MHQLRVLISVIPLLALNANVQVNTPSTAVGRCLRPDTVSVQTLFVAYFIFAL